MELKVIRTYKGDKYTIGKLYVNGVYWCNTLEDKDRDLHNSMSESAIRARKVYGQTAIPRGQYPVTLTYSAKFASRAWAKPFKGLLPLLGNVKGFDGIRIHPGNTESDTLGCILIGENSVKGKVLNSTRWFNKLMNEVMMPSYKKGERVTIDII